MKKRASDTVHTQNITTLIFKGKELIVKKPSVARSRRECEDYNIPYIELDETEPFPDGIYERREDGKIYRVSLEILEELNQWPYKIFIGETYDL